MGKSLAGASWGSNIEERTAGRQETLWAQEPAWKVSL